MGLSTTFAAIAKLPGDEAVPFLEAALVEPFVEIQRMGFRALEKLRRKDVVIRAYSALLPEVRELLLENKGAYMEAARREVNSGMEKHRRAAYEFLSAFGGIESATLLAAGIDDASSIIRESVGGALEKIALKYHYHLIRWRTQRDASAREYVEANRGVMMEMLEQLLRAYQIHRKDIFVDIAIETGVEAYALIVNVVLGRKDVPLQNAFLKQMDKAASNSAMEILFRLFLDDNERLEDFARQVFTRRRDPGFVFSMARYFSTLSPEKLGRMAAQCNDIPWWPAIAKLNELDPSDAEEHLRFIARSRIDRTLMDRYLRHFFQSISPTIRARALVTMKDLKNPNIVEISKDGLRDPDARVQLAAAQCLVELDVPDLVRLLTPFIQSENEELRNLAMREVARSSFDRYLNSFDRLDPKTRALAAKAISKIDHNMMHRVAGEVMSMDATRRLKALQILNYAELGPEAQPIIRELLADPDTRVRATAIKLMEMTGNVEAMKLVLQLLNDPDRRVRANAVEAFEEIGDTRFVQILLPFVEDPDNRVRANAVKALWRLGRREVVDVLFIMLRHDEEMMRLSAVWALGEIRPEGAADALAKRMLEDPSEAVKAKIEQTLEKFHP